MGHRISHEGIITSINEDEVQVKILSKSSCGSCNIKGACNMSEMQEKIITIPTPKDKNLSIGQEVKVSMGLGQANKAVVFAYVIPLIILVAMIFILNGGSASRRSRTIPLRPRRKPLRRSKGLVPRNAGRRFP